MLCSNEKELIDRLRLGDQAAFSIIYDSYLHFLHIEAYYKVGNYQEAEDIVHEVMSTLWERRERLSITFSLRSYLIKAVHFQYTWRLRKNKMHRRFLRSLRDGYAAVDTSSRQLEKKEILHRLHSAIEHIPSPSSRNAVRLGFFYQMSHIEVAEILNTNVLAVRTQASRGIKVLRNFFASYGCNSL